jgi:hypothetical protein
MGRGRAKAKQTKVARDLKYNHPGIDLDRLTRELGVNSSSQDDGDDDDEHTDDTDDPYGYDDEDDGASHRSHHRGS